MLSYLWYMDDMIILASTAEELQGLCDSVRRSTQQVCTKDQHR